MVPNGIKVLPRLIYHICWRLSNLKDAQQLLQQRQQSSGFASISSPSPSIRYQAHKCSLAGNSFRLPWHLISHVNL